jgi:hypothetical protein
VGGVIDYVKPSSAADPSGIGQGRKIAARRCSGGNGPIRAHRGLHGAGFPAIVSAGLRGYDTKYPGDGIHRRPHEFPEPPGKTS